MFIYVRIHQHKYQEFTCKWASFVHGKTLHAIDGADLLWSQCPAKASWHAWVPWSTNRRFKQGKSSAPLFRVFIHGLEDALENAPLGGGAGKRGVRAPCMHHQYVTLRALFNVPLPGLVNSFARAGIVPPVPGCRVPWPPSMRGSQKIHPSLMDPPRPCELAHAPAESSPRVAGSPGRRVAEARDTIITINAEPGELVHTPSSQVSSLMSPHWPCELGIVEPSWRVARVPISSRPLRRRNKLYRPHACDFRS